MVDLYGHLTVVYIFRAFGKLEVETQNSLILLMVQESGVQQLRLVVEIPLSKGIWLEIGPLHWMIESVLLKISCPPDNSHHQDQYT